MKKSTSLLLLLVLLLLFIASVYLIADSDVKDMWHLAIAQYAILLLSIKIITKNR